MKFVTTTVCASISILNAPTWQTLMRSAVDVEMDI